MLPIIVCLRNSARLQMIPWAACASCFLAAGFVFGLCGKAHAEPMNLIVIQTDEHHFNTLGCYGGKVVKTPSIDWLANHGALCTSFYATTPVCSPSRASLVTGMYPQKTPVTQNNVPLDDSAVTFAELLRRRGYATGYAGKWHLDGSGKPQWAPQRKFGFEDNRFMFNRGHWKRFLDTETGPRVGSQNPKGQPDYGLHGADEKTFATDWLCDKLMAFVRQHRDEPFCYMLSLPDPHGPNTVRAPYDTMYANVEVSLPASFRREAGQIPGWGRPTNLRPGQLRQLMRKYYGMVKCIDDNVGEILATLRELKLMDDTMIVFTSDHGDLCGEHGRLNKGVPYEGSARIPFVMYCPGKVMPKTVVDQALSCVDFLPTVMSLLETPVPHEVDGRDASSLFQGMDASWNDACFLRSTSGKNVWLAAVTESHKLVYSTADEPWLLELKTDPDELSNRFGEPELRSLVATLTQQLQKYARDHHDAHVRRPQIRNQIEQALKTN